MNDNIFTLFMKVIDAAKSGQYMFGNGREWFIMERGEKIMVDTIAGTITPCPAYNGGAPRSDMDTAISLEKWLMLQEGGYKGSEWGYYDMKVMVKEAVNDNRLLHTNGNTWTFVHTNGKTVVAVDLGVMGQKAAMRTYNALASWKYMREVGSYRAIISEATKKYMNF